MTNSSVSGYDRSVWPAIHAWHLLPSGKVLRLEEHGERWFIVCTVGPVAGQPADAVLAGSWATDVDAPRFDIIDCDTLEGAQEVYRAGLRRARGLLLEGGP